MSAEVGAGRFNVPLQFATKQLNRLVQKILQQKNFATLDEVNKYLAEEVSHTPLDELVNLVGEDPVERAQELAQTSNNSPAGTTLA